MATSLRQTPYAFPAEVARFLAIPPTDILALIRQDKLPATPLPKAKRIAYRIYLPDLHAWLLSRSKNPGPHLTNYAEFLTQFDQTARTTSPRENA